MVWAAMSSAGVGPLCLLKSTVNAAIYQDILEHIMFPSALLDFLLYFCGNLLAALLPVSYCNCPFTVL